MTSVNQASPAECHDLWTATAKRQPFTELEQRYRLTEFDNILHADTLNSIKNRLSVELTNPHKSEPHRGHPLENRDNRGLIEDTHPKTASTEDDNRGHPLENMDIPQVGQEEGCIECGLEVRQSFKCQDSMGDSDAYYETIIFRDKVIPTRPNSWHDLFNGLIWLSFPKTKSLLNQWHVEDIQKHGLTPRTHRRNQITLFDECGVILAVSDAQICENLTTHQWQKVFVEDRIFWGKTENSFNLDNHSRLDQASLAQPQKVKPFVFGHANYEMLMAPFLGLTGKWLAVRVEDDFFAMEYAEQLRILDAAMYDKLSTNNRLSDAEKLFPLPLLGVPGWFAENQNDDFYLNTNYFRPLRK